MALDKNDGVFLPSIEGVVSGKTSQVDGMNGIMNNLIGNDNYLKNKKLDKGNYVGTAENLHADDNAIWGGEYGGYIQDTSVTKVVGKRYIDQFDKKAYICRVAGSHVNTTANYEECSVVKNKNKFDKLGETFIQKGESAGHLFDIGDIKIITVPFPKKFDKTPLVFCSVGVSVYDLSASTYRESSYSVNVGRASTEGFLVAVKCLHQSGKHGTDLKWVAFEQE